MTNHNFSLQPLLASKKSLDALPPDLLKILKEESRRIRAFQRALSAQRVTEAIQFMKNNGIIFTETDYPAFRKAMDPVYAMFQAKLGGDLIDRISRAANA